MPLILHIGHAKCASTYLQDIIFPKIDDINYMGRRHGKEYSDLQKARWVRGLIFFDKIKIGHYADILNNLMSADKPNLLSHEGVLKPNKMWRTISRLRALEELTGTMKIVVSIRNQIDIVMSRYMFDRGLSWVREYSLASALDFEGKTECEWPHCCHQPLWRQLFKKCACRKANIKFINVPFYNYLNLWCLLSRVFKKENVHFLVAERLKESPSEELKRLTDFIGSKGMDETLIEKLGKERSNVQPNQDMYNRLKKTFPGSEEHKAVVDLFSTSNRILSDTLGLSLSEYGYF